MIGPEEVCVCVCLCAHSTCAKLFSAAFKPLQPKKTSRTTGCKGTLGNTEKNKL